MSIYKNECDQHLVELALRGDVRAFEELVIRHEKAVLGTAYKITKDHYRAEDAAQEAFATAWRQLNALKSQSKFRAYVCAIAKNYAKKMVTHDSLISTVSITDFENRDFDDMDQNDMWQVANDDMYDRLYEEIESLSDKIKAAILLHYFDGLSVKDIAIRLNISQGTVKWRLSEGRKQLKNGLGNIFNILGGITMFKNIFIIGSSKAGNTTLAKMIAKKYGYSVISIDDIVTAMEAFPDMNISWNGDHTKIAEQMAPFLAIYLKELSEGPKFYNDCKTVIEGSDINFELLIPKVNKRKYHLIGLTYNQISKEELFQNIRKNDTEDDWTYYLTDEQLEEYCEDFVEKNKFFNEKFKEYGITSYDTSTDRETVLRSITENLENNCRWEPRIDNE